jgi:hypothetical protein
MPVPKTFRNNQIEGLAEYFLLTVSEDSLRSAVPQKYRTVRSGHDDRIAGTLYERSKVDWPSHHNLRFSPLVQS